jgi:hypothetical protein
MCSLYLPRCVAGRTRQTETDDFHAAEPNRLWVADLTYNPLSEIPSDRSGSRPGSAAVAARESPSGRWVPYVRMTRPLKRPMRVALTDHLAGVQSMRESSPAECSWPFQAGASS